VHTDQSDYSGGPSSPPAAPAPVGSSPSATDSLRQKLASRFETAAYTAKPFEHVAGLTGGWTAIQLKLGDQPLMFADRSFKMPGAKAQIEASARQLRAELLDPLLAAGKQVQLYVRGGADSRSIRGRTDTPDRGRDLQVLLRLADGTYSSIVQSIRPAVPVSNKDLPNLRADWVQQVLQPVLLAPGGPTILLWDNLPSPGQPRTVELLLYVEW
jgi:hypothetical protein